MYSSRRIKKFNKHSIPLKIYVNLLYESPVYTNANFILLIKCAKFL